MTLAVPIPAVRRNLHLPVIRAAMPLARRRQTLGWALGLLWLLDAALQFQPFMFTRDFVTGIVEPTASGNPAIVAHPLTWAAHLMLHHVAFYNALFATIQLAIAVGIVWPRTTRAALAVSIAWSLAVWWFAEGLGGILVSPTSDPFMGAPGAVVLYAFMAVLAWPRPDTAELGDGSVATRSILGRRLPGVLWAGMWVSFAYMLLEPANRAPGAIGSMVSSMGDGEPSWVRSMDTALGNALAGQGTWFTAVTAVLCVLAGVGVLVPRLVKPAVVLAAVLGLAFWVAENFGGIFTGKGTDPNSGLVLMVAAAFFWPVAARRTAAPDGGLDDRAGLTSADAG